MSPGLSCSGLGLAYLIGEGFVGTVVAAREKTKPPLTCGKGIITISIDRHVVPPVHPSASSIADAAAPSMPGRTWE